MNKVTIKNSGATFTPTELADYLANKIYNDILIESHPVIESKFCHKYNGFRIITVDMKNRCLDHAGDIRAI